MIKLKKSYIKFTGLAFGIAAVVAIILFFTVNTKKNYQADISKLSTDIKMTASSKGFMPNDFVVPVGKKVTWEIQNDGSAGCTASVVARGLVQTPILLGINAGDKQTVSFTAEKEGDYIFSCAGNLFDGHIKAVNV
jgi:plastocyanin domain-containing protein